MDYRTQEHMNKWLEKDFPVQSYDRVAIAGGVYDLDYVIGQVELAVKLHKITRVVLVNHEDCGAYGAAGTYERHKMDLEGAERKIKKLFPNLNVETYYLHLDGIFEKLVGPNLGE
jgi:carbonic anhydrase